MIAEAATALDIRIGRSARPDAGDAAAEIAAAVRVAGPALTVLFASPQFQVGRLVGNLARALPDHEVVGCTTAGEISPEGFHRGTAVAMSLRGPLTWSTALIEGISTFTHLDGKAAVRSVLADAPDDDDGDRSCAMLFVDGLQGREEMVTASLGAEAPALRVFGASASDDFLFQRTHVFHAGRAHSDAALLVWLHLEVPFQLLRMHHFHSTGHKVVVTGAEPESRLITEFDGKPAVEVLAELTGEKIEAVRVAGRFFKPFATMIRGEPYIRSIMRLEGDALRFACAVEEGAILTLMEPGDMVADTVAGLERVCKKLGGEVDGVLAFNCLGRLFEAQDTGRVEDLARAFQRWPVIGLQTYGEQYGSVHVNATLTGIVLGRPA